jgi:hypothetical protein
MYFGKWPDMDELFWIPLCLLTVMIGLTLWGNRKGWNLKKVRWLMVFGAACFTLAIALFYPAHTRLGFRNADNMVVVMTWLRGAAFAAGLFFLVIAVFLYTPERPTDEEDADPTS